MADIFATYAFLEKYKSEKTGLNPKRTTRMVDILPVFSAANLWLDRLGRQKHAHSFVDVTRISRYFTLA